MKIRENFTHHMGDIRPVQWSKPLILNPIPQRISLHQFHHDIEKRTHGAQIIDLDDIRMGEGSLTRASREKRALNSADSARSREITLMATGRSRETCRAL